jgi:hypothetical protein
MRARVIAFDYLEKERERENIERIEKKNKRKIKGK